MRYHINRSKTIKADCRFVWRTLNDFANKYFEHVAYVNTQHKVQAAPTKIIDFHSMAWSAEAGMVELSRYQDARVSRDLESVAYTIKAVGTMTRVNIDLTFSTNALGLTKYAEYYFALKPVIDDNLVWLKTIIEDEVKSLKLHAQPQYF